MQRRPPAHALSCPVPAPLGYPSPQILFSVVQNGHRPAIPEWCPSQLAELMQRCWAADPQARPDAAAVVEALQEYAAVLRPGTPASG